MSKQTASRTQAASAYNIGDRVSGVWQCSSNYAPVDFVGTVTHKRFSTLPGEHLNCTISITFDTPKAFCYPEDIRAGLDWDDDCNTAIVFPIEFAR